MPAVCMEFEVLTLRTRAACALALYPRDGYHGACSTQMVFGTVGGPKSLRSCRPVAEVPRLLRGDPRYWRYPRCISRSSQLPANRLVTSLRSPLTLLHAAEQANNPHRRLGLARAGTTALFRVIQRYLESRGSGDKRDRCQRMWM